MKRLSYLPISNEKYKIEGQYYKNDENACPTMEHPCNEGTSGVAQAYRNCLKCDGTHLIPIRALNCARLRYEKWGLHALVLEEKYMISKLLELMIYVINGDKAGFNSAIIYNVNFYRIKSNELDNFRKLIGQKKWYRVKQTTALQDTIHRVRYLRRYMNFLQKPELHTYLSDIAQILIEDPQIITDQYRNEYGRGDRTKMLEKGVEPALIYMSHSIVSENFMNNPRNGVQLKKRILRMLDPERVGYFYRDELIKRASLLHTHTDPIIYALRMFQECRANFMFPESFYYFNLAIDDDLMERSMRSASIQEDVREVMRRPYIIGIDSRSI